MEQELATTAPHDIALEELTSKQQWAADHIQRWANSVKGSPLRLPSVITLV